MSDKERKSETADATGDAKPGDVATGKEPLVDDETEKPKSGWSGSKAAKLTAAELEKLSVENEELKDRVMRAMAEMENLRRRTEREKADTVKYSISNFARDIVGVGDNIRRAIEAVPEDDTQSDSALTTLLEGVAMTERELMSVLERHGITRVEPKGERFDPNLHQAMFEIEDETVEAGTIVELVQPGYQIADRVLRPAMVGVSKGGPKRAAADSPSKAGKAAAPAAEKSAERASETPAAANDDAPKPPAAAKPQQGRKTPLPDPSRALKAEKSDTKEASPGDRRPVGTRVDKSA